MPDTPEDPGRIEQTWRWLRIAFIVAGVGFAVWQVVYTEWRVAQLRERGFTDVVISSTRDHAYFPLIGAYIGAGLFIAVGLALRRLLRRG